MAQDTLKMQHEHFVYEFYKYLGQFGEKISKNLFPIIQDLVCVFSLLVLSVFTNISI